MFNAGALKDVICFLGKYLKLEAERTNPSGEMISLKFPTMGQTCYI